MSLDTANRQAVLLTGLPLQFTSICQFSRTDIHRKDIITEAKTRHESAEASGAFHLFPDP